MANFMSVAYVRNRCWYNYNVLLKKMTQLEDYYKIFIILHIYHRPVHVSRAGLLRRIL